MNARRRATAAALAAWLLLAGAMPRAAQAWLGPHGRVVDWVCDLDEFLVYLEDGAKRTPGARYLEIDWTSALGEPHHETYRVTDGAPEFLTSLKLFHGPGVAGVRLNFYSAKERARNEALLRKFPLSGALAGRTAYDAASRLFHYADMPRSSRDDPDQEKIFRGDRKKDLTILGPEALGPSLDTSDVILLDDQRKYAAKGQEKNLLLLNDVDYDVKDTIGQDIARNLSRGQIGQARRYSRGFLKTRNKLAFARGVLGWVAAESARTGQSFSELLWSLQWQPTPEGVRYRPTLREQIGWYRAGVRELKQVDEDYRFTGLIGDGTLACLRESMLQDFQALVSPPTPGSVPDSLSGR